MLTRAEEIGFIGTLGACRDATIPKEARLITLENSRSFADSPVGGGPIVRVGDRLSVFSPTLTSAVARRAEDVAGGPSSVTASQKLSERPEFAEFVAARSPALLRTARLLTGDWAAAEDLLQDTLAACWRRWSRIEGNPEPYVHRVLVTFGSGDALRDQASQSVPVGDVRSGVTTTATFARACTDRSASEKPSQPSRCFRLASIHSGMSGSAARAARIVRDTIRLLTPSQSR